MVMESFDVCHNNNNNNSNNNSNDSLRNYWKQVFGTINIRIDNNDLAACRTLGALLPVGSTTKVAARAFVAAQYLIR
jgi:hypothetical protein